MRDPTGDGSRRDLGSRWVTAVVRVPSRQPLRLEGLTCRTTMKSVENARRRRVLVGMLVLAVSGCAVNPPAPPLPLAGTLWTLQALSGMPVTATEPGVGLSLQIDASARRVAGSTGVNRYMGGVTYDAQALTLSAIAASRRAGPLPAMALERSLLNALEATRAYRINGAHLDLLDGTGELLARFVGPAR